MRVESEFHGQKRSGISSTAPGSGVQQTGKQALAAGSGGNTATRRTQATPATSSKGARRRSWSVSEDI